MVYIFANFNDYIQSFEEESVKFTAQRYPIDALNILINQTKNEEVFFVGQSELFDRYMDNFPKRTKRITLTQVKPRGLFLVYRKNEGFVYRVIAGETIRKNNDRVAEILWARKKYGGKK